MDRTWFRTALVAVVLSSLGAPLIAPGQALAQATCRNKCNDEEQACLKRTGNKGQCGNTAKSCLSKCK